MPVSSATANILNKLDKVQKSGNGYKALCPGHEDRHHSLSISEGDRKVLLKCFVGCSAEAIVKALGLEMKDLFTDAKPRAKGNNGKVVVRETSWDITDHQSNIVARHVRLDHSDGSKSFMWRRNGKDNLGGLKAESLPLYGLKSLMETPSDKDIIMVEGEKVADCLNSRGYLALGTVTGASSCPSEETLAALVGRTGRVLLWSDNDDAGQAHMVKVAKRLLGLGIHPYVIQWQDAPPRGDAADYLMMGSDGLDDLLAAAQLWQPEPDPDPPQTTVRGDHIERRIPLLTGNTVVLRAEDVHRERTGVHAKVTISLDNTVLAWDTFNITRDADRTKIANSAAQHLSEDIQQAYDKKVLKRDLDSFAASLWDLQIEKHIAEPMAGAESVLPAMFLLEPYVIKGGGTILFAPPGRGKSYIGLLMAVSIDGGVNILWSVTHSKVLYVNLERSRESMERRLALVNATLGLPEGRPLLFLNARGMALYDIIDAVKASIKRYAVKVIFLDSISRSGFGDLNENAPANRIVDALNSVCSTWFALGHTPRQDESHIFGSMHFEAGADIMVQALTQEKENLLGIGLQIVKANDIGKRGINTYTLAFDEFGLCEARGARPYEFGELHVGKKQSLTEEITQYLLEVGEATATEIEQATQRPRTKISTLLNNSEDFLRTRKEGNSQYFGLKAEE